MALNSQQIKVGLLRALLGLMPLLLMGTLTLITFYLVEKNTPQEKSTLERVRLHEPDYTIKQGTLSALNEVGNTKYRVIGKKLIHYDDDASIDILTPRMRLFQTDKAPVTVKADTGHLDGDLTIMDLYDNAEIFRPAQAATETQPASLRMLASSSYFKVFINDDIIETDKPVTLEQGMSIMNSTAGGTFYNVDQSMKLSGQVKGRIERAPKGAQ
ncbi:LPS export ABC transporter periplasmic protein LptC [Polynucleobacter sp. AP-Melu-500A-A1]|uniref:LPS export ABC transporter periplasmic protein LptC n=1 Tax=Polynucleobacter sp. AP-Melu-500A-A1 TaxID=2576929 RepID=UPI001C0AF713|nr:LPS export ABC transporter periplasmic protein LptC [Polynucleobacter sp. AP-Melu-500A-A1]MBU3629522.1 LPS export ABC transporter periplasmic protein LptC [Polynucleobacter sp. AP-Melu-500A-A1]